MLTEKQKTLLQRIRNIPHSIHGTPDVNMEFERLNKEVALWKADSETGKALLADMTERVEKAESSRDKLIRYIEDETPCRYCPVDSRVCAEGSLRKCYEKIIKWAESV